MDQGLGRPGAQQERHPRAAPEPPSVRHVPRVDDRTRRVQPHQPVQRRRDEELVRHVAGRQRAELAFHQRGVEPARTHLRVPDERTQERHVRRHAQHRGVGEGTVQPVQGRGPVGPPGDDLGQHRVVVRADDRARVQAGVHPDVARLGFGQAEHRAPGGHELARRVLGVDTGLGGVPLQTHVVGGQRQPLPRRHAHLPLHQVHAGDQFGDRVLHLQPGVHLQEEELVRAVGGDDALDGARADVPDRACGLHSGPSHALARVRVEQRRRCLLDDLLVPPLQAALPLTEVQAVTVGVGEHLDLDVPRRGDEPLDEQPVVAERPARLAPRRLHRLRKALGGGHHPHPLAATTGRRLQQHRIAHPVGGRRHGIHPGHVTLPGDHGNARGGHGVLGADLVAHRLDRRRGRSDEHDPGVGAGAGEGGVLGEEPVAGVHRLRAGVHGGAHDVRYGQVTPRGLGRTDPDGDIGLGDVPGVGVGVAVDRHRADPHPAQRGDHPDGDLAPVRDQNRVEHAPHILKTP